MKHLLATISALALAGCATGGTAGEDAAVLHQRLLTLDTHLDTPLHFGRPGWRFDEAHSLDTDLSQIDIPRMASGALDGGFFVIYTDQGPLTAQGYADALAHARTRSDLIDRTIAAYPEAVAPALTGDDARRLTAAGKLIAFKSIENSYPLGEDLSLLAEFHRRGVRMAGPVHGKNNQFADSSTDTPRWGGLSPLGRQWVAEMNRLGMVIDGSHASDAAFGQMLDLSKTPIILSHSSSKAFHDHPRNIDEGRIRRLAEKGGAICLSTIYLSDMNMTAEREELFGMFETMDRMSPAEQADFTRRWRDLDTRERFWNADFEKFMAMVLRTIEVAGVDGVCFGADWDGGGGIDGIQDITAFPKLTERLRAAGYSEADLQKMWSGNVLRILDAQTP